MSKERSTHPSPEERIRKFERHVVEEIQLTDTAPARAAAKREWLAELKLVAAWFGLWLMLTLAGVFGRSAWLPDETRVLGVAWDMWVRGNFSLPYLNGAPESYPPLLLWLIHFGWSAFGVSEGWAKLVTSFGILASLFVTQRVAHVLWPQETDVRRYAPLILLGMFSISLTTATILPEAWTLFFVLTALWGLLIQWRRRDMRAWLLTAVALVFGALTCGVFIFVYVLPLAILAPLWAHAPRPTWKYWYLDIGKAVAAAVVVLLGWLLAAAPDRSYVLNFLAQSSQGTMLDVFPRAQPWWWYAWVAPLVFLPWSVLPLAWMRFWHIRREPIDAGFGFCLAWLALTLLALSALPVKQPQYLLPLLPAVALLSARLLLASAMRDTHHDNPFAGMAIPIMAAGGVLMALPRVPRIDWLPGILWEQSPWVGLVVMLVGIGSAWLPITNTRRRVFDISLIVVLATVFVVLGAGVRWNDRYALEQAGAVLAEAQTRGLAVAHVGEYRGEYHFAGRLRAPLMPTDPAQVATWIAEYPDGVLITLADRWPASLANDGAILFRAPLGSDEVLILDAQQILSTDGVSE
jgi:4-amino-4-deoxy-L-arabinose transferase-like glycosyltransferase